MGFLDKIMGKVNNRPAEIPENAVWVDCRAFDEYQCDHLGEALNIPHSEMPDRHTELGVDKDHPVYLYCAGGKRAEMAKQCLEAQGYTQVVNVGGLKDAKKCCGEDG